MYIRTLPLVAIAISILCVGCPEDSEPEPRETSKTVTRVDPAGPAQWLYTEKMRGLYGGGDDDLNVALKEMGYNTIFTYWSGSDPNTLLKPLESAKKNGLRVFPATHFWHYPYQLKRKRRIATADGTVLEKSICPLDKWMWHKCGIERLTGLAKLALEHDNFVGVALDIEMYEKVSWLRYCYCIDCLKEYAQGKGLDPPETPGAGWLRELNLHDDFTKWQEDGVFRIVREIRDEIHKINPELLFAVLPFDNNRFMKSVARGLAEKDLPVILMTEYTYNAGFSPSIIEKEREYRDAGINAVIAAGLSLLSFPPHRMANHSYNAGWQGGGYWAYITGAQHFKNAFVTGGWHAPPAEWRAWMQYANDELDRKLADPQRAVPVPLQLTFAPPPTAPPFSASPPKYGAPRVAYCPKGAAPTIDGKVDKGEWDDADAANAFYQFGSGSTPATWQTAVQIKRDDKYIYLAIRCREPEVGRLRRTIAPSISTRESVEETFSGDVVELFICPDPASNNYYHFSVNVNGSRHDDRNLGKVTDGKWNGAWASAVGYTSNSWVVEMRIAYATLGIRAPLVGEGWRVNFYRTRNMALLSTGKLPAAPAPREAEQSTWSPTDPITWFHQPANFHHLLFR